MDPSILSSPVLRTTADVLADFTRAMEHRDERALHINDAEPFYETNRNNHNSSSVARNEVNSANERALHRKRRPTVSSYRNDPSHRSSSRQLALLPMYINNLLLVLIRLMILLIVGLIIGFTCYYAFISMYPKPKSNQWKQVWYSIIDWLAGE